MKIAVGSTNPVKIKATKNAFEKVFPDKKFKFIGIEVPSGVSDQPIGTKETLKGATNRAIKVSRMVKADFYVGIEGGVNKEMNAEKAWMVIIDKKGNIGKASTGTFSFPKEIIKYLKKGKELGDAVDIVFKKTNSKHSTGAIGLLTHGVIDREKYYRQAMILALIPFVNKKLYFEK